MAPLTWRNVDAPDFSGASEALARAGQGFAAAGEGFKAGATGIHDQQVNAASNRAMAEMARYTDRGSWEAALQNGSLSGLMTPSLMNDTAMAQYTGKRTGLINDDDTLNTMWNRDQQTAIDWGNLDLDRTTEGRLQTAQTRGFRREDAAAQVAGLEAEAYQLYAQGPEFQEQAQAVMDQAQQLAVSQGLETSAMRTGLTGTQWTEAAYDQQTMQDAEREVREALAKGMPNNAAGLAEFRQQIIDREPNLARRNALETALTTIIGSRVPVSDSGVLNPNNFHPNAITGSESGNNFRIGINSTGEAAGRAQMTNVRLKDAADAGVVPPGTTIEEYKNFPSELQQAVENWHWEDHTNSIIRNGLDQYLGTTINGTVIDENAMMAMAHLGGFGGLKSYLESGGRNDPNDKYGTTLSSYAAKHSGTGLGPTRTAAATGQMQGNPATEWNQNTYQEYLENGQVPSPSAADRYEASIQAHIQGLETSQENSVLFDDLTRLTDTYDTDGFTGLAETLRAERPELAENTQLAQQLRVMADDANVAPEMVAAVMMKAGADDRWLDGSLPDWWQEQFTDEDGNTDFDRTEIGRMLKPFQGGKGGEVLFEQQQMAENLRSELEEARSQFDTAFENMRALAGASEDSPQRQAAQEALAKADWELANFVRLNNLAANENPELNRKKEPEGPGFLESTAENLITKTLADVDSVGKAWENIVTNNPDTSYNVGAINPAAAPMVVVEADKQEVESVANIDGAATETDAKTATTTSTIDPTAAAMVAISRAASAPDIVEETVDLINDPNIPAAQKRTVLRTAMRRVQRMEPGPEKTIAEAALVTMMEDVSSN